MRAAVLELARRRVDAVAVRNRRTPTAEHRRIRAGRPGRVLAVQELGKRADAIRNVHVGAAEYRIAFERNLRQVGVLILPQIAVDAVELPPRQVVAGLTVPAVVRIGRVRPSTCTTYRRDSCRTCPSAQWSSRRAVRSAHRRPRSGTPGNVDSRCSPYTPPRTRKTRPCWQGGLRRLPRKTRDRLCEFHRGTNARSRA